MNMLFLALLLVNPGKLRHLHNLSQMLLIVANTAALSRDSFGGKSQFCPI